jgi:hypothetical protein
MTTLQKEARIRWLEMAMANGDDGNKKNIVVVQVWFHTFMLISKLLLEIGRIETI